MAGSAVNEEIINPTYDDIGDGDDKGKGYATLQHQDIRERPLPIPNDVKDHKTYKQMKAYRVAVIVLSIVCALLIAAVLVVYFLTKGLDADTTACLQEKQENDTSRSSTDPVDLCHNYLCLNGGSCTVSGKQASCICPQTRSGDHCERTDYCSNHPCLHGGTCVEKCEKADCECVTGYLGENCELDLGLLERDITRDILFCQASSVHSSSHVCEQALDNNRDTEWASSNEGVGAWYEVFFRKHRVFTKLSILQRWSVRQTRKMELEFMDGTTQNIELKCSTVNDEFGIQDFILTPVNSSFIKITFTDVCTTQDNGFHEIKVWGF